MFRIKICGITRTLDAFDAAQAGAEALGFNFYRGSKRYVYPRDASDIAAQLPASLVKVGVFVNASADEVLDIARLVGLDAIQLHGDEPSTMLAELVGWHVIRAVRPRDGFLDRLRSDLEVVRRLPGFTFTILVDAFSPADYGGTGQRVPTADFEAVRSIAKGFPLVLAGGLTPANIAEAIQSFRPDAVDTASGVESSPGVKDAVKIRKFVHEACHSWQTLAKKPPEN